MSTRSPTRPKRRIALAAAQLLLPDANPQRMEIDNFHELPIDPQTPYTASASDQIYQIIIIAMIISIIKYLFLEGANKQVISSQADSLIKISRIWADFFPANTSNQPI